MRNYTNGPTNGGSEASYGYSSMHTSQNSKPYVKPHGSSDYGGNQSVEAYRRQHEITVSVSRINVTSIIIPSIVFCVTDLNLNYSMFRDSFVCFFMLINFRKMGYRHLL